MKPAAQKIGSAFPAVYRWPTKLSKSWTENLVRAARDNDSILAVVAIGSAVRPNVASVDLDLIMIAGDSMTETLKPPIEIDLRVFGVSTVDAELAAGNDLLGWAVKFGQVLHQKDAYWDGVVASWANRLPFPSPDVADRRAREAYRRFRNVFELGDSNAARELAVSYLTHVARGLLLRQNIYPASRPELPAQLRIAGVGDLARRLEQLQNSEADHRKTLECLFRDHSETT